MKWKRKIIDKEVENKDLDEPKKVSEHKKQEHDNYVNEKEDETFIIIRSRKR